MELDGFRRVPLRSWLARENRVVPQAGRRRGDERVWRELGPPFFPFSLPPPSPSACRASACRAHRAACLCLPSSPLASRSIPASYLGHTLFILVSYSGHMRAILGSHPGDAAVMIVGTRLIPPVRTRWCGDTVLMPSL